MGWESYWLNRGDKEKAISRHSTPKIEILKTQETLKGIKEIDYFNDKRIKLMADFLRAIQSTKKLF